jgi:uncharacterized transporter YbjL
VNRLYRNASILLSFTVVALGVAMIAVTLAQGGGQLGVVLGVLFIAAGAGRLYVQRGR